MALVGVVTSVLEGEGSRLPLPSLPQILPLTGEHLGRCGSYSGAGQRAWLPEAAFGAHSFFPPPSGLLQCATEWVH